jgi:hypothetical protein
MGDAELVKGLPIKTELKDFYDPSLAFFRAAVQCEGYLNSSRAKLQLKDVVGAIDHIPPL